MAINYLTFANTDGNAFPNTAGKNSSGPGTVDGTEWVKLFVDDVWGFNQALLNYTDDTPTGVSESNAVSQRLNSIKKIVSNLATVSTPVTYTVDEWNTHGVLIALAGATAITIAAGTGTDQSNQILVYNQSGISMTVDPGTGQETLLDGRMALFIYDGSSNFVRVNNDYYTKSETDSLLDFPLTTSVKTSDYTILDTDTEDVFIADPNSVQFGLLTIAAPATGGNTSKVRRVEHGAGQGLVRVNANGAQRFNFDGTDLQYILLYSPGQYVEFYWNTNTAKWTVKSRDISFNTGFQGRSTWTSMNAGNGVTYDGKSAAVDFTGTIITEATSGFTGVVVHDSGGTGTSGIFYVYDLSSNFTFWTNNRVLTASDGTTALVNEISGQSKNVNYNLYFGFGRSTVKIQKEIAVSTDKSEANTFFSGGGDTAGVAQKSNYYGVDTNQMAYYSTSAGAFTFTDSGGLNGVLVGQDYFYNHRLIF